MLAEIVRQCQRDNPFAQKRLYEHFANRMYRLCRRYVPDAFETEEVLMNGFLKIFRALGTFEYRSDDELEVWMKRIMVNEALMYLRRKVGQKAWSLDHPDLPEAEVPHAAQETDADLQAEAIHDLILRLPHGYRTVFCLYAIEGYSHREIAALLGVSENTSKSQLSKARAMLQKLLIKNGYEQERR
ncbi:sigma-70 family RNA polymerase sigma factor [Rhabdobacter roseus]|uniref:RNA polymerase sigma-70 factor (ECF subfamily) n=1 Tax=Rhabdobacter roseus TaxID=1655419 RepID=A0A840TDP7_9BACT|nr:RNA polymerase sigma factor [Rhabdobacter roseus]MBB5282236.1 RNA polymerase sigma-70 factor (ECF subfamily) [Rhabdobacter roseus]